jgi:hypothetical protein
MKPWTHACPSLYAFLGLWQLQFAFHGLCLARDIEAGPHTKYTGCLKTFTTPEYSHGALVPVIQATLNYYMCL